MKNKEDYLIDLDTLFDNIDLYDEDDIDSCIKAKKDLQKLINEYFDETEIHLIEPFPSKSITKTLVYACKKCKHFVNKDDNYCCGCGRRIKK